MEDFFKKELKAYLDDRSSKDELFAKSYAKENKNLDECIDYITSEVVKLKVRCSGFDVAKTTEAQVYNLAVHYYDEDNLKVNKVYNARVSTPTPVTLTEEDKAAAKERALRAYEAVEQKKLEEREKARKEALKKKAAQQQEVQPYLFEF